MSETSEPKEKSNVGKIVCWVCGVLFALCGIVQISGGTVFGGLLMLVGGVLLLPPILSTLEEKAKVKQSVIIIISVVLIILGLMLSGGSDGASDAADEFTDVAAEETEDEAEADAETEEQSDDAAETEDEAEDTAEGEDSTEGEESSADEAETNDMDAEAEESEDTEAEETESAETSEYEFDAGYLSYLGMTRDKLLAVYTEFEELLLATDTSSYTNEEQVAFETECAEMVAANYGITVDDVTNIYIYGGAENYFATFDVAAVEMTFGETVEVKTVGGTAIIEAKITPSYSNEATIDQNYYNVCDFIRDYAGTDFVTVSYWAIADMSDGSEQKVISFDLTGDIITTIATGEFADNTLGDYVDDLWVHESLRDED